MLFNRLDFEIKLKVRSYARLKEQYLNDVNGFKNQLLWWDFTILILMLINGNKYKIGEFKRVHSK